ncbi:uncharacterized protein LOC143441996 [Arvicanthis niloticus]|uniref:uncharacterized protein LOC143312214 n=1 Tax=Arvicanthis niloticus TaxID=61156 RepID=UPI00402BC797
MRARLGPARPVTVPVDPGKGHRVHNTRPRTCPRSRDTGSAPRRPAGAHREARDRAGSRSARPRCGLGTPRAPPEAAAAPPAAQNNARPPRHSPLTWPCRLPAGAPTARGIVGSRLRDARHGKGNWPGPGHGSMASARTRRAAARDCGMSPCSLLSPRAGFRRCAAPPPRQPRQEGARTRRAPTRSPGPRPPARSPRPAPLTAAPAPGAPRPARETRKVRRKVRVSGLACGGRNNAPPGSWKAKGGKEAARVLGSEITAEERQKDCKPEDQGVG